MRYLFDDPARRRAQPQDRPVLRDDGPPGHLRRRLEGGHPPPVRRPLRRRPLGAVPPRRGPLGVPRPGRRAAREAGRAGRPVVAEAEAHGVLPLDDRTVELFGARFRDRRPTRRPPLHLPPADDAPAGPGRGRRSAGAAGTCRPPSTGPAGAGGVLYATGNENSGMSLFVDDDRLVFDYNCFGDHQVVESDVDVPVGSSVVGVRFRRDGTGGGGHPGHRRRADAATLALPFVMRMISSVGASIGFDHGSPVSRALLGRRTLRGHPAPGRRPAPQPRRGRRRAARHRGPRRPLPPVDVIPFWRPISVAMATGDGRQKRGSGGTCGGAGWRRAGPGPGRPSGRC